MRLVEHSARTNRSSISCWRVTVLSLRRPVAAPAWRSLWLNAKRSPSGSPAASQAWESTLRPKPRLLAVPALCQGHDREKLRHLCSIRSVES